MTKSEAAMTSKTSPRVPSASEKPQARASSAEAESLRRPMETWERGERGEGRDGCVLCEEWVGVVEARRLCPAPPPPPHHAQSALPCVALS